MALYFQGISMMSNLAMVLVLRSAKRSFLQISSLVCVNTIRNNSDKIINEQSTVKETEEERMSWELLVDYSKLSPVEIKIHKKHADAVRKKLLTYIDPRTGYIVMTRLSHLQRGECCGNACRHCPYGQKNVPDGQKKKFNTAFYI